MRQRENPVDRFWNNVAIPPDVMSGCWVWTAATSRSGYGFFSAIRRHTGETRAHRNAWALVNGEIPRGMFVLHNCDSRHPAGSTEYRRCVNPAHLWLGTDADNKADMHAKRRHAFGDRAGPTLHVERMPRGDSHYARARPELLARGERNGSAKLTQNAVVAIRQLLASGWRQADVAARFGISQTQVSDIHRGRVWAHVR